MSLPDRAYMRTGGAAMPVPLLTSALRFPPVEHAIFNGLLAIGGDLSVKRLLLAYHSGIFPWYSEGEPIQWYSPDPRMVLFPEKLKVSRRLRRTMRGSRFTVTCNRDFRAVIGGCKAAKRRGPPGTWLTGDMVEAYLRLHEAGHARSVEVWQEGRLAGGLYGVAVGRCFCGESMFAHVSDASKVGLVWLVEKLKAEGFTMIDCQFHTPHLEHLGAVEIARSRYLGLLKSTGRPAGAKGQAREGTGGPSRPPGSS